MFLYLNINVYIKIWYLIEYVHCVVEQTQTVCRWQWGLKTLWAHSLSISGPLSVNLPWGEMSAVWPGTRKTQYYPFFINMFHPQVISFIYSFCIFISLLNNMCFPIGSSCCGIWTAWFQRSEIWTCVLLVFEEPHGILNIHAHFRTKTNSRFSQFNCVCRYFICTDPLRNLQVVLMIQRSLTYQKIN